MTKLLRFECRCRCRCNAIDDSSDSRQSIYDRIFGPIMRIAMTAPQLCGCGQAVCSSSTRAGGRFWLSAPS